MIETTTNDFIFNIVSPILKMSQPWHTSDFIILPPKFHHKSDICLYLNFSKIHVIFDRISFQTDVILSALN